MRRKMDRMLQENQALRFEVDVKGNALGESQDRIAALKLRYVGLIANTEVNAWRHQASQDDEAEIRERFEKSVRSRSDKEQIY